jgi:hypothetical protein
MCLSYTLIQYPRFQSSTVYDGQKKSGKLNKYMVLKFHDVCQTRIGRNVVKSSNQNVPITGVIILCPCAYQDVRIPYFHMYKREKVHCKYTMQCTVHFIITLFNVGIVSLCVIHQLNFTICV